MNRFNELLEKFDSNTWPKTTNPFKILIIDDSLNIQQALKRILIKKNYRVTFESTGQGGIDALTHETCAVILDIKLPKMDGLQVYVKLKEKNPDVPIIFYSAYPGDNQIIKKCLSLNPYAFIEKGVAEDIEALYLSIEKAASENKDSKRKFSTDK
ncbi:MAG: response regulator [Desulfobacula sp.]|jgi:CheY-like chemotaxis protein|uniref:response regulator n=1 Tax=Desulfobacula sp. TaxID=2593537 RepID=UPI001D6E0601|nr:response regulator [Desulfobacula sp.]MBT3487112.1 response regulator [Desulfobacula sp.]MBT3806983.1 response regulator [Desulfobacula sp.]MBT4027047.1 response regulator [Desulfobacula sp.]MBT4199410.1 response regulator [Desulfobacula sp.]